MAKAKKENNLNQIDEKDIQNMNEEQLNDVLKSSRKEIIDNFSEVFKGIIKMHDEEPTEEFVKKAQEDYEKAVSDFQEATYEIYKGSKALDVTKFLYEWNDKCNTWERQAWKGVIAFHDIMKDKIEELEKVENVDDRVLILEYAPLVFIYGSMMNPRGLGYEKALEMEVFETDPDENNEDPTDAVTYSNILEWLGRKVDGFSAVQSKIQALQERWTMAASGFGFDFVSDEPEIYVQFTEAARNKENDKQV